MRLQVLFRRRTMPKELDERPDDHDDIDAWVAEKSNTTDETMADLVNGKYKDLDHSKQGDEVYSILVPYIEEQRRKLGLSPAARVLFIVDGAGSHKGKLFKEACRKNNIDLAV